MPELAVVDEIVKNKPPLRLFKYRQVNAATEQLLLDNEIYCSTPYQFNDPFECRPLVHLDVHSTETKEWLNRNMAERGITNPSTKLAIRRRMKHSYVNPRPIEELGFDKVLRQIGIYSMTADPASLLMLVSLCRCT